jgi:hypothetical protein
MKNTSSPAMIKPTTKQAIAIPTTGPAARPLTTSAEGADDEAGAVDVEDGGKTGAATGAKTVCAFVTVNDGSTLATASLSVCTKAVGFCVVVVVIESVAALVIGMTVILKEIALFLTSIISIMMRMSLDKRLRARAIDCFKSSWSVWLLRT